MRNPTQTVNRISLSSPADALSVVPYLLGFQPEESLVMLVLDGGRVAITARFDLAAGRRPDVLAEQLQTILEKSRRPQVLLCAFTADAALGERVAIQVAELAWPVPVLDALVTDGDSWRRVGETEWQDFDPRVSPAAAGAVVAGLTVLDGREQLIQSVAGPAPNEESVLVPLAEAALEWAAGLPDWERAGLLGEWLAQWAVRERPLTDEECLRLAAVVSRAKDREAALQHITLHNAEAQVALWRRVVERAVGPLALPALCLLAAAGWASGNGALQGVCLERAALLEPQDSMFAFLRRVHEAALPPSTWDQARAAVVRGSCGS